MFSFNEIYPKAMGSHLKWIEFSALHLLPDRRQLLRGFEMKMDGFVSLTIH